MFFMAVKFFEHSYFFDFKVNDLKCINDLQ